VIIGLIAGVLVCLSVEFIDRVMKVDDPVGAISVHGTNGLWGVISVGLFADGKSNYGGSWGGVNGNNGPVLWPRGPVGCAAYRRGDLDRLRIHD
jgi:ammonia channel protein AmtB